MLILSFLMGSSDADGATCDTAPGIASGGGEFVATDTEVINVGVADHRAADDRVRSVKHEEAIGHIDGGLAVLASLYVAEITMMSGLAVGTAMNDTLGVPVRSSSNASFEEVSVDMNVESVLSWRESNHFTLEGDLLSFNLGKFDDASD